MSDNETNGHDLGLARPSPSSCEMCKGTGVFETGNNDVPCACAAGDSVTLNTPRGPVLGSALKAMGIVGPASPEAIAAVQNWGLYQHDVPWPARGHQFEFAVPSPAIFQRAYMVMIRKSGIALADGSLPAPIKTLRIVFLVVRNGAPTPASLALVPCDGHISIIPGMPQPEFLDTVVDALTGNVFALWSAPTSSIDVANAPMAEEATPATADDGTVS